MVSKQGSHAFNFIHQGRGEVLLEVPSPRKNVLTGLKHKDSKLLRHNQTGYRYSNRKDIGGQFKTANLFIILYSVPALKSFLTSTPMCLRV